MRTLLLWCPDWPVIAAELVEGVDSHQPVAVLHANRVLASSAAARAEGVRRGLRKREAQGRCPRLVVVLHDPDRDAKAFEPVLAAVEQLAPGVEVVRPGACALAARGPASYYGGEAPAAERLVEQVALTCAVEAQVGVADGVFAAMLAARAGRIIAPGQTRAYLADKDITVLDRPDLADLLRRLGIRTLGDFAALPAAHVLARFGFDAAYLHRLANGDDERPLAVREPPPDLTVTGEYDPPLERIDIAAFAAKALADRLADRLAGYGLATTRLGIQARTAAGEELHRVWRHDGLLDAAALADRVRWQLDGWLTGAATGRVGPSGRPPPQRPTAGIDRLRLVPDGVVRYAGMQAGLWGEIGPADERAHRALVRVQGLLGPDSVFTALLEGGRGYADRVRLIPWGDERCPNGIEQPWPGRLPAPAPATVLAEPAAAVVETAAGTAVAIDDRLGMAGPPASITLSPTDRVLSHLVSRQPKIAVIAWAGPWPVEQRWWAPAEATQLIRLQLLLADGTALLVAFTGDQWTVEAIYD